MMSAVHEGLRSIGNLAVIGLTCTLIGAILSMPALLQVLENRAERREAREEAAA